MMRGILAMSEQTVREVMSPRIDIAAVSVDATVEDVMDVVTRTGFSRIPLYEESLDHIVGVIYAKDVLAHLRRDGAETSMRAIARDAYFVPETKRVDDLLAEIRGMSAGMRRVAPGQLHHALIDLAAAAPLSARVSAHDLGELSTDAEQAVFYCVSEALQNAVKHAGSRASEIGRAHV